MRILLATADAVERLSLETLLREWGYEVTAAGEGLEALEAFNDKQAPALALLDWNLPGLEGPRLCRKLRDRNLGPYVYVILLGEPGMEQNPLAALEAGADDFIPNPLDQAALRLRLRAADHILALQHNLLQSRQALEYKATHDELTGLWNRAEVLGLLERDIARSQREGTPVSIIMIDVDHFKEVNDALGHLSGDEALRQITGRMSACVRPYDGFGRYGGEEFLVVLSGCSGGNAARLAERLRGEVAATSVRIEGTEVAVSISLGVASWNGEYGDMQALIRAADAALYQAKKAGRNLVQVAWDEGRGAAARRDSAA